MKKPPLFLYSTNTLLAFKINEEYYYGLHFVWCTPIFDGRKLTKLEGGVPPSSSPLEIYEKLHHEVRRQDRHSDRIDANRTGIKRGAEKQRLRNVISADQELEINRIANEADRSHFEPLMYVIPYSRVKSQLIPAPLDARASEFSREYTIQALPRELFDALELVP